MVLRLMAYFGSAWAARRLDRKRFARKYLVVVEQRRFNAFCDRLFGR
ncbi:hypothetical protein [uncultured Ralstonia sp.]|jgi:hypothetical protein|nr:hypothetical protein [uncultured Ralstonia sp.]